MKLGVRGSRHSMRRCCRHHGAGRHSRFVDRARHRLSRVHQRHHHRQARGSAHPCRSFHARACRSKAAPAYRQRPQRHRAACHRLRPERATISPATRRCARASRPRPRARRHANTSFRRRIRAARRDSAARPPPDSGRVSIRCRSRRSTAATSRLRPPCRCCSCCSFRIGGSSLRSRSSRSCISWFVGRLFAAQTLAADRRSDRVAQRARRRRLHAAALRHDRAATKSAR